MDINFKIKKIASNVVMIKNKIMSLSKDMKQEDFNFKTYLREKKWGPQDIHYLVETIGRDGYNYTDSTDTKQILIHIIEYKGLDFVKKSISQDKLRRYGIIDHYSEIK